MNIELKKQIVKEYLECKDRHYIAAKYSISCTSVSNYTKQLGYKTISNSDKIPYTNLTQKEVQIIEGLLLGDGGIYPNPITCNLVIGSIHRDYILYLQSKLKLLFNRNISMSHRRSNEKPFYTCKSRNNKCLVKFRKDWYKQDKQVPSTFIISSTSLLHWFIGDGCVKKNHIQLCTDSFNESSVDILQNQLYSINIDSTITTINNRQSTGFRINIHKKESRYAFYEYIGACPAKSFNYKWPT